MIQDNETDFLYLADCLSKKDPTFFTEFQRLLVENHVRHSFLPKTKDIWAVDFMPLQLEVNSFVKFRYEPDYLQTKTGLKTISDVPQILQEIGIITRFSNIVLDGGNVVKGKDIVILCDKVLKENSQYNESGLIKKLEQTFEVSKVILIPTHKSDFTGHADGMVRFIDEETVLINKYVNESREFRSGVRQALNNAGLKTIEFPYNPYKNASNDDAFGIYINYLEMKGLIIVPTFDIAEDEEAVKLIEQLFPSRKVLTINSCQIAKKGGVLNCITWNIKVQ